MHHTQNQAGGTPRRRTWHMHGYKCARGAQNTVGPFSLSHTPAHHAAAPHLEPVALAQAAHGPCKVEVRQPLLAHALCLRQPTLGFLVDQSAMWCNGRANGLKTMCL